MSNFIGGENPMNSSQFENENLSRKLGKWFIWFSAKELFLKASF